IFENVLGDDRVINVIGAQAANLFTGSQIRAYAPNAEAVAIAPYYRNSPRTITGWPRDWIAQYANCARQEGLMLIAYEGGQHFVGGSIDGGDSSKQLTVAEAQAYNRGTFPNKDDGGYVY